MDSFMIAFGDGTAVSPSFNKDGREAIDSSWAMMTAIIHEQRKVCGGRRRKNTNYGKVPVGVLEPGGLKQNNNITGMFWINGRC
jgi:hypothetical protein